MPIIHIINLDYDVESSLPYAFKWFVLRIMNPYGGSESFKLDSKKINQSQGLADAIE